MTHHITILSSIIAHEPTNEAEEQLIKLFRTVVLPQATHEQALLDKRMAVDA